MSYILPKEGDSQEIGKKAGRAFIGRLPSAWSETSLDGDFDFGLDYLIQVKNKENLVSANFYLQLKGTTIPSFVNDGNYISFQFDSSTLNYYRQSEPAVMVVLVDLSKSEKPRECPVYYKWLDENFLDSIAGKIDKNDKVSIRIPIDQELDEGTDILPYYFSRLASRDSLIGLRRAVEEHSLSPKSDLDALAKAVKEKPIFLQVLKDDSGAPWINNPDELVAGKLKGLFDSISANKISQAEALIDEIQNIDGISDHECAEFYSLKGKLSALKGADEEAYKLYQKSYEKFKTSRYKVGFFESKFRLEKIPGNDELEAISGQLDDKDFSECALKVKCLALLDRMPEVMSSLSKHPTEKTIILRLMVFIMAGDIESFDAFCQEINVNHLNNLNDCQKLLYNIFLGRRLFYKGIGYIAGNSAFEIVPAKGKPDYDINLLKQSIGCIRDAMRLAKEESYPYEVYMIIDIAVPLFSIFNCETELVRYIETVLSERQGVPALIRALVLLKFNTQDFFGVINLIGQLSDKSIEDVSYLIAASYKVDEKRDVIELTDKHKNEILDSRPQNYKSIFCMAAHSAYELLDEQKEKEYLEVVATFEEGEELAAIYNYIKLCNLRPENSKEYKLDLYRSYLKQNRSIAIAQQLFHDLNAEDEEEASMICELAETIQSKRELFPEENLAYAFALSIGFKWSELQALCEKISDFEELDNLWSLLKASALDEQGYSQAALEVLDDIVDRDRRSIERGEKFVNLCLRLGFFEKAEEKLTALLEKAQPNRQINILESLLYIYSADVEPSERLIPALIRYGEIVDKEDEFQEARYLMSFLVMTNRPGIDVSEYGDEFRQRLNNYTNKFPESRILRSGSISDGAPADTILKKLQKLAGISDLDIKRWTKNRNLLKSRQLPVPFAMLPDVLDDVGDIFTAWVFFKHYRYNKKEYQLVHAKPGDPDTVKGLSENYSQLVLDESSLLVLSDIGLLDCLLSKFDSLIINKATYESFAKASHVIMGSTYSLIPKGIVESLGRGLDRIILKDGGRGLNLLKQYNNILSSLDSPVICTDDLYLSEFLKLSAHTAINTLNIIDWLHAKKAIEHNERINAIESLCSLGLCQTSVDITHVVDSLEYNIIGVANGQDIMDTGFKHVFDAAFSPDRSNFHASNLLSEIFGELLNRTQADVDIDELGSLINLYLLRFPSGNRLKLLSTWFVKTCLLTKYYPESAFLNTGKGQVKLLSLLKKVTVNQDPLLTLEMVYAAICDVVLTLSPDHASDVYDSLLKALIAGSAEQEMLSKIYTDKAVNVRLGEIDFPIRV